MAIFNSQLLGYRRVSDFQTGLDVNHHNLRLNRHTLGYVYIYILTEAMIHYIWGLELGQWSLKGFNGSTCFVRELDDYPVDISDVWLMVTHIRMGTQLYTSGSPLNG